MSIRMRPLRLSLLPVAVLLTAASAAFAARPPAGTGPGAGAGAGVGARVGAGGPATAPLERNHGETESTAPPADAPSTAWPPQTEEERAAAVRELKQRAAAWNQQLRFRLVPYETKYFLFFTDLSQTEANRWARQLDQMYARLAQLFAVPKDENLWRGKAVIFVWQNRDDFLRFESEIFRINRRAGGRCHYERNGNVVITFYRAPSDADFARILVHETTHGFFYRYRSGARIPSWMNEGLAEVMEFELVPAAGMRQASDADAKAYLREPDALRGFFGDRIEFPQYPVARTLTEFMVRQHKLRYVEFVNAVKSGMPWREAMAQKYGVPLERLVAAYGASMGVPGLRVPAE